MTQRDVCFFICFGEPAKSCFEDTSAESQKKHIVFDMDYWTFFKSTCEGVFFLAKL